ncbi:MAG: Ig-like domain-containing protein [Lachnospiraceae bacterium]|nr:Ig-like domain-containing protein [Lachnospiraceae bacterium]
MTDHDISISAEGTAMEYNNTSNAFKTNPEETARHSQPTPANTTPPKKKGPGLIVGIIIAAVVVIALGFFLYNSFFVPREIHVSDSTLELMVGDTASLTYTILPERAGNSDVAWASSDSSIASVDEYGTITAVSGGQCAIAVATGNGKTDTCVVTVIDPRKIQKESLEEVRSFISGKATSKEAAGDFYEVRSIDENHSFLIGENGENLVLAYRLNGELDEMGVDAQYTTYVVMTPENIDTADITQENNLVIYDFPISMTAGGIIDLPSYKDGDTVAVSSTNVTVDGLDATAPLHDLADDGTAVCVKEFGRFLEEQGFEFGTYEFGLTGYGTAEAVAATGEETAAEEAAAEADTTEAGASAAEAAPEEAESFSAFPTAAPTPSAVSFATESLAKTSSLMIIAL